MALFPGCWEQGILTPRVRTEPRPAWYDPIAEQFQQWRSRHARSAWRPVVRSDHVETRDSRFGGPALLRPDERWPVCDGCGFPLSPFVQLNLATLPHESPFRGEGVFQLFYCRGDSPDRFEGDYNACEAELNEGWAAYGGGKLTRLVTADFNQLVEAPISDRMRTFDCRPITAWEEFADVPEASEHESCGLEYDYSFEPGWTSVRVRQPETGVETLTVRTQNGGEWGVHDAIGQAAGGDKLGGWPKWVQYPEYPDCRICGKRMNYVLQIDSAHNVPYVVGDGGTSHVFQCGDHPEVVTLNWQCS